MNRLVMKSLKQVLISFICLLVSTLNATTGYLETNWFQNVRQCVTVMFIQYAF